MKRRMVVYCLSFVLSGCGRSEWTVETGKRETPEHGSKGQIWVPLQSFDWRSPQDFWQEVDQNKLGLATLIYQDYRQKWRTELRRFFREWRDQLDRSLAHSSEAQTWTGPLTHWVDACQAAQPEVIFDHPPRLGAFPLFQLIKHQAPGTNHEQEAIDPATRLVFFEIGIDLDGQFSRYKGADKSVFAFDLTWSMIHEQGEPSDWRDRDAKWMRVQGREEVSSDELRQWTLELHLVAPPYTPDLTHAFVRYQFFEELTQKTRRLTIERGLEHLGTQEGLSLRELTLAQPDADAWSLRERIVQRGQLEQRSYLYRPQQSLLCLSSPESAAP